MGTCKETMATVTTEHRTIEHQNIEPKDKNHRMRTAEHRTTEHRMADTSVSPAEVELFNNDRKYSFIKLYKVNENHIIQKKRQMLFH